MATLSWDLVGGNPAPGDRAVYRELSKDLAATARSADSALRRLDHFSKSCDESVWQGEAADAFRAKIRELPPKLQKLHRSHDTASRAMADYGAVLEDLQPRARKLLERAQEARRDELVQKANRDRARAEAPDPGPLSFLSTPTTPFDRAVEAAQNRQRDINRQIDQLRDDRKGAEGKAVGGLERAQDQGIKNDSWLEKRLQGIDKWVDKNADHLKKISGALKIVSAAAGVLSFIPVLNFIAAPIALLAGGAALAIDGTLVATGNGSWKALGVDAALMALPGAGKLIKAGVKAVAKRARPARIAPDTVGNPLRAGGEALRKLDIQDGPGMPAPGSSPRTVGAPRVTGGPASGAPRANIEVAELTNHLMNDANRLRHVRDVEGTLKKLAADAVDTVLAGNSETAWGRILVNIPEGSWFHAIVRGNAIHSEMFQRIWDAKAALELPPNIQTNIGSAQFRVRELVRPWVKPGGDTRVLNPRQTWSKFAGLRNTFGRLRPDIRLPLGGGEEAIWDLTTVRQLGHSLPYADLRHVRYLAELHY